MVVDTKALVFKYQNWWVVQGIDIDYAVQGHTVEEAEQRFKDGLIHSIILNEELNGDGMAFLKPAPDIYISELMKESVCETKSFSVSTDNIKSFSSKLETKELSKEK